ncbi:hypothetical protein GCM10011482_03590 [Enterococcus alcedinis]|uniref:Uncharacterized protein n=1 Tax=Enterococcus alcedinis TaxID=1274384 RepID=A0A917JCJ1_9ENTE|nr:hypothetical protein GCM10011482_03590 [Enterococcus alcedinis]
MNRIQILFGYLFVTSLFYSLFWFVDFFVTLNLKLIFVVLLIIVILIFKIKQGTSRQNPFSFHVSFRNAH